MIFLKEKLTKIERGAAENAVKQSSWPEGENLASPNTNNVPFIPL